jgi:hypothetical protein
MEFRIPQPLKTEHEELHAELVKATRTGGQVAGAAKAVAKILHLHFVKKEEYVLPPLALLPHLARGEIMTEMKDVLTMTDRLLADLPQLLQEHKAIVTALKNLSKAARQEKMPECLNLAETNAPRKNGGGSSSPGCDVDRGNTSN